jgi:hypothetical protein
VISDLGLPGQGSKIDSKKKRENGCLGKAISFPSSLGIVLKALKGHISKDESLH